MLDPESVIQAESKAMTYTLISAVPLTAAQGLVVAWVFGPTFGAASTGLYHVLRLHRRTVTSELGLKANVAAAVTVTLMLFVQLGLDVAWDLFLALGTVLLAWNMWHHPRFASGRYRRHRAAVAGDGICGAAAR